MILYVYTLLAQWPKYIVKNKHVVRLYCSVLGLPKSARPGGPLGHQSLSA